MGSVGSNRLGKGRVRLVGVGWAIREGKMREFPALSTVGGMPALLVLVVGVILILLGQGLDIPV